MSRYCSERLDVDKTRFYHSIVVCSASQYTIVVRKTPDNDTKDCLDCTAKDTC